MTTREQRLESALQVIRTWATVALKENAENRWFDPWQELRHIKKKAEEALK